MIKQLIKLANELDKKGLRKEADYLDALIKNAVEIDAEEHREMTDAEDAAANQGARSDSSDTVASGVTPELMHKVKCLLDQTLVPFKWSEPKDLYKDVEKRHTQKVEHYSASKKLSESQRTEILAYLDRLETDRQLTPPKYGGYTCPKGVKWLPYGVIWTGNNKVVTKGDGVWD